MRSVWMVTIWANDDDEDDQVFLFATEGIAKAYVELAQRDKSRRTFDAHKHRVYDRVSDALEQ